MNLPNVDHLPLARERNDSQSPGKQSMLGLVVKVLVLAWLTAALLFAHGCHGNEDHELFTVAVKK